MNLLMILALAVGLVFGVLFFYLRKEVHRLDEENQLINLEKQMVLDFMHNMVEALGQGLRKEELFQRIVHAAILSSEALSACVFEKDTDDKLRGVAIEGLFPPQRSLPPDAGVELTTRAKFIERVLKSEVLEIGEGVVGDAARTGEVILVRDGASDDRIVKHHDPSLEVKSLIAAPILFRDRLIGVLVVANPSDGLPFDESDVSLIRSLSEQAGLAIHNSNLLNLQLEKKKLDMDLALASNIQQMLLPKEYPSVRNMDIDACYIPAQKVGGDLYDFIPLSGNRMGVVIADVSGKGMPASLLMTICRTNLRHFSRACDSPAQVLSELNRAMAPEMLDDMFITITYAIIDMEKNAIRFSRCGHELPLLFHYDRKEGVYVTDTLESRGMAVGLVPGDLFDKVIEEKEVAFERGDIFMLYTDGITEACNEAGVEFSVGRLADVVKMLHDRSAREINQGVIESIDRFVSRSTGFEDDITLVAIKHL